MNCILKAGCGSIELFGAGLALFTGIIRFVPEFFKMKRIYGYKSSRIWVDMIEMHGTGKIEHDIWCIATMQRQLFVFEGEERKWVRKRYHWL
jgi:hypothetical protein